MNNKNAMLIGLFFMIFGILLFIFKPVDAFIRPVTSLFLMGSSAGKDILFFELFGFFILAVFSEKEFLKDKNYSFLNKENNFYIKHILIISSITLIIGQIIEIYIRLSMNVSIFTTLVSTIPKASTTSILHSHVFKGVFTQIATNFLTVPSSINTGSSLMTFIPPIAYIVFLAVPVLIILAILAMRTMQKVKLFTILFASTCLIIGMIDGGFFSTPILLALTVFYWTYTSKNEIKDVNKEMILDYIKNALSNIAILISVVTLIFISSAIYFGIINVHYILIPLVLLLITVLVKKQFITDNNFMNHIDKTTIIIGSLIILRVIIGLMGTNVEYYEITVIDGVENDEIFSEYEIVGEFNDVKLIKSSENERDTLIYLKDNLNAKGFFMSWNSLSFFKIENIDFTY